MPPEPEARPEPAPFHREPGANRPRLTDMPRFPALLGVTMLLALTACGQTGGPGDTGPDHRQSAFEQRAAEVARTWQAAPALKSWQTGYVPLQEPTLLVGDPGFDDETKQAFAAGWYREQIKLPTSRPADGTVHFPDGTLTVPLVSAAEAYQQLRQGDPPPCPARPMAPPAANPSAGPDGSDGPDRSVSSGPPSACILLTITDAKLGTVAVRTSRGEAQVPAWLFTIEELTAPVARIAVAPSAVGAVPEVGAPAGNLSPDLVAAQDLTRVTGAELTYRLGIGACDTDPTPLVWEEADLVVVGGAVTRTEKACNALLVLEPVTVTLDAPLGARAVLDAMTGQPLRLIVP